MVVLRIILGDFPLEGTVLVPLAYLLVEVVGLAVDLEGLPSV